MGGGAESLRDVICGVSTRGEKKVTLNLAETSYVDSVEIYENYAVSFFLLSLTYVRDGRISTKGVFAGINSTPPSLPLSGEEECRIHLTRGI